MFYHGMGEVWRGGGITLIFNLSIHYSNVHMSTMSTKIHLCDDGGCQSLGPMPSEYNSGGGGRGGEHVRSHYFARYVD